MQRFPFFLFSLCCLFLWTTPLLATEYTIQGQVSSDQASTPTSGVEINIYSLLDQQQVSSINTDANGAYSVTLDLPYNEPTLFLVEALDPCSVEGLGDVVMVEPAGSATLDLIICKDNNDPTDCNCPIIFDEVCVEIEPGIIIPFPNACEAECAGFDPSQFVVCDFGGGPVDTTDCNCPFELDEVCVEIEPGLIIPFPNACWAECEGFTVDQFVVCDFGGGPVDTTDCNCPFEIDQVCVEIEPGLIIPFLNACWAECEGFTVDQFVECEEDGHCGCDCNWDPVCIQIDSLEVLTFPNACLAECEGYDPADFIECEGYEDPMDCGCTEEIDEVCVEVEPGFIIPFPNACWAECAGFDSTLFVECDFEIDPDTTNCGCTFDLDPVCVIDSTTGAEILFFLNPCLAECAGYDDSQYGACDVEDPTDCGCPAEIDEVCVELEPGLIIGFPNACEAECAGFDPADFVACDFGDDPIGDCGCTEDIDPVCIELAPGLIIPFPNACLAECAGFDPAEFVDCENDFANTNVLTVRTGKASKFRSLHALEVFPNPVESDLNLNLELKRQTTLQLGIFSLSGQQLKTAAYNLDKGQHQIQVAVNDLPEGLYLIQVNTNDEQRTLKFVK